MEVASTGKAPATLESKRRSLEEQILLETKPLVMLMDLRLSRGWTEGLGMEGSEAVK